MQEDIASGPDGFQGTIAAQTEKSGTALGALAKYLRVILERIDAGCRVFGDHFFSHSTR
jgi:hypothetical protein